MILLTLVAVLMLPWFPLASGVLAAPVSGRVASPDRATSSLPLPDGRYLYVFNDGTMTMYAMDHGFAVVGHATLPTTSGTRGIAADPTARAVFVSYGGDGGTYGNGSLLKLDLLTNLVVWTTNYPHGIDSMAITPDGRTIYLPEGEVSTGGKWYLVNASDGSESGTSIDTGAIAGDCGPHNTVVSLDGTRVYLGDRNLNCSGSNYLYVASTATNVVVQKVGPFQSGVRPFTINGSQTLAYVTVSNFLGFQVGDLTSGQVLYTVPVRGFTDRCSGSCPSAPSHGISLSPDERELYLVDFPNNQVHVFDVSAGSTAAPTQVADIPVTSYSPNEQPCAYDCLGDSWLLHSRDGSYVFVGDSGDVIDTSTRSKVANLPALANTRKMIEIDWQNGAPFSTTTRHGLGYVTGATPTPAFITAPDDGFSANLN